jgi:AcrR family transcriptional regulator
MASTRTKPAEDRRADLLAAGARVFAERGIAAASVADLTAAAGVAKGTFYLYFDSKETLLGALQEQFVDAGLEKIHAALEAHRTDDWIDRLDTYVAAFLQTYFEQGHLHDVLFHHLAPPAGEAAHRTRAKILDSIEALLRDGTEAEAFAVDDPAGTAELLYSTLHGTADAALHHDRPVDPAPVITAAQDFVRRAVGAHPPTGRGRSGRAAPRQKR